MPAQEIPLPCPIRASGHAGAHATAAADATAAAAPCRHLVKAGKQTIFRHHRATRAPWPVSCMPGLMNGQPLHKGAPAPCPCCRHAPASSTVRQQHSPPGTRDTGAATPPLSAGQPSRRPAKKTLRVAALSASNPQRGACPQDGHKPGQPAHCSGLLRQRKEDQTIRLCRPAKAAMARMIETTVILSSRVMACPFKKQVNKPEEFRGGEEASGNRHQRMLPHRERRAPALARNRARVNPYPEERSAV